MDEKNEREQLAELQKKMRKISEKAQVLGTKDGVIQLDPNDPLHRAWYDNDEDYDI